MSIHSPGPFAVAEEPFSDTGYLTEVVIPDPAGGFGTSIASCHHNWREAGAKERRISWAEAQANARLFSASDELLWFAQQIFNGLDTDMLKIETPADETLANVLRRGRAAIGKATGPA